MNNRIIPSIVLFGDSITQFSFSLVDEGWGLLLSESYSRKVDIINRGYSGYNTRWALHLLPQIFNENSFPSVKLITIWFGANDASLVTKNARQHVPLDEYEENLVKIVNHLSQLKSTTNSGHPFIILVTPPPIDEKAWLKTMSEKYGSTEVNRINSQTGKYRRIHFNHFRTLC